MMPFDINVSRFAQIAQSVEQRTENPRVGSSILSLGTIRNQGVTSFGATPFSLSCVMGSDLLPQLSISFIQNIPSCLYVFTILVGVPLNHNQGLMPTDPLDRRQIDTSRGYTKQRGKLFYPAINLIKFLLFFTRTRPLHAT